MSKASWSVLVPDRVFSAQPTSGKGKERARVPPPPMIGRIPEAAVLRMLQLLPVRDMVSVALCNRKTARLLNDDRVWKEKLRMLGFKGAGEKGFPPGMESFEQSANAGTSNGTNGGHRSRPSQSGEPSSSSAQSPPRGSRISRTDFSQFEIGDDEDDEDAFGDFVDSGPNTGVSTMDRLAGVVSGIADGFEDIALGRSRATNGERDLLALDGEDDFGDFSGGPPSAPLPTAAHNGIGRNGSYAAPVRHSMPPQSYASSKRNTWNGGVGPPGAYKQRAASASSAYRSAFMTYYNFLVPFFVSLQTSTTSSLVFSQPTLSMTGRVHVLSTLQRFLQPSVAPTRSIEILLSVRRNLQSAMDWFESTLLAEFEKLDERGDEAGMRDRAHVLCELNGGTNAIQIYVQKRAIFYDSSFNPLKNLVKVEAPTGELVDGVNFDSMVAFMDHILATTKREGDLMSRIFPLSADVIIFFAERIATDVLSEYITPLLSAAQPLPNPLFLMTSAAVFAQMIRLSDAILAIEPRSELTTRARADDVIHRMFEVHIEDYLQEETDWVRENLERMCREWDSKVAHHAAPMSDASFLSSANPAQVKKTVLSSFTKTLLLPVTIVPKTVAFGATAIFTGGTAAFNTVASLSGLSAGNNVPVGYAIHNKRTLADSNLLEYDDDIADADMPQFKAPVLPSDASTSTRSSMPADSFGESSEPSTRPSSVSSTRLGSSTAALARMQLLLSLDVALQLLQANRDSLKRVKTFTGYTGIYGQKVRDAVEEVFIILLETLCERHLLAGFGKAMQHMESYQPEEHGDSSSVMPLIQFFELAHIGDTIMQMVHVYYEKEMSMQIDRNDFLNAVVREKRRFERSLDDAVAQGFNAGVNILMNQVEYLIINMHDPRDYSPPDDADMDLQPTAACKAAIASLSTHCQMLKGSTDKQILEIFFQEVGIRLHGILIKHIKRSIISLNGGFRVISDLNAYHQFILTLRQPTITTYFTALKMVGNIYIIDSPKDLAQLVRDASRYEGILRVEDLYEFIQRRADFKKIERDVDREMFGLKVSEDCVVS